MKIIMAVAASVLWVSGRHGWAVLTVVLLVLIYLVQAVFFPFGSCWACKGSGRWYRNKKRRSFRDCWWCGGAGRRKRVVRRLYDRLHDVESKAR